MKILHFLDTVNRGGAETLVLDVCRNAEKFGLNVSFAHAGGGALETDFKHSGFRYFRLHRRLPFDPMLVSALRNIIKDKDINIVHTHQAVEALHALAASFGTNTKVVLTHHGIVPDRKNLLATRFLIPRVAHNILVGNESKKNYEREFNFKFPPATSVIYNGVDAQRLKPSGADFRTELNLPNDAFLIGMIGNFYIESRKDQATICRALPKILKELPNVYCVFAGKIVAGAEEKLEECVRICAENNISDKVHFLGGRSDVPDILDALDIFINSSLAEGLPIAVNEAMLARVPTILSDIAPLLEASNNGEFAEIFKVGDENDLSEKVLKLLKDENLKKNSANRAKQFAENNFSIAAHLESLKNLYKKLSDG